MSCNGCFKSPYGRLIRALPVLVQCVQINPDSKGNPRTPTRDESLISPPVFYFFFLRQINFFSPFLLLFASRSNLDWSIRIYLFIYLFISTLLCRYFCKSDRLCLTLGVVKHNLGTGAYNMDINYTRHSRTVN